MTLIWHLDLRVSLTLFIFMKFPYDFLLPSSLTWYLLETPT